MPYFAKQKNDYMVRVTLEREKSGGLSCSVRVDFAKENCVDFNAQKNYLKQYCISGLTWCAHDRLFEASILISLSEGDRICAVISHLLEPLSCSDSIIHWLRAEVAKMVMKPSLSTNPHVLMAVKKASQEDQSLFVISSKL